MAFAVFGRFFKGVAVEAWGVFGFRLACLASVGFVRGIRMAFHTRMPFIPVF